MSTRYGDRGPGRYGDPEDDRSDERGYERGEDRAYGERGDERPARGSDYGLSRRGGGYPPARGADYDYGRDYGYGRDYTTRDQPTRDQPAAREFGPRYGAREYGGGGGEYGARYGRERPTGGGGRVVAAPRRYEGEDQGREYAARNYERGRARHPAEGEGVRDYDTDYGRTTSRFYGRSGYEYGREDYDRDDDDRDERRGYRARGYRARGYAERGGDDEREGGSWLDRAADQVRSWFGGEEDADDREGRGRREEMRGAHGRGKFRGLGPRNYRRSDERLREEVCDRLTDNEWLDASDVDCNVVAGEVILTGTVDSRYAKRLAENIAESVSGVSNVQNNLRVQGYEATRPETTAALPAEGSTDITAASDVTVAPGTDATDPDTSGLSSRAAGRG